MTEEDLQTRETMLDVMAPPAKGWRNWFHADTAIEDIEGSPGDFPAGMVWPTEDMARTKALGVIDTLAFFAPEITWLGAFPDGEKP